jgi:hypothetical protein
MLDDRACDSVRTAGLSSTAEMDSGGAEYDKILFAGERMYCHQLARFNYTTYDVRRAQDVVNPKTPHRDIMLLGNQEGPAASSNHRFLYGRVLGLYHVNAVYTGSGMRDYVPRRVHFLWVRWFEYVGKRSLTWRDCRLDSVRFPPTANDDAFGFVDPRDVLRGCQIIPAFVDGKVHLDGVGISRCAADSQDWHRYYVNRYANLFSHIIC